MDTALALGGWFLQTTVETLVDRLSSSAIEAYGLQAGLGDALSSLESSLLKVNVILRCSQKLYRKEDKNLNKLLKQLKETAYDAEDLIDELEYENLKLKIEEGEGDHSTGIVRRFAKRLKYAKSFLDDNTTRVLNVQHKLTKITADLKEVLEVLQVLPNVGGRQQVENDRMRPETTSFLTEPVVLGRDMEKDELIKLLLNSEETSESNNTSMHVISVVGIGGVGKTTLAQSVYNDDDSRLRGYFQEKLWICASDPFDVKKLTKDLVWNSDMKQPEPSNLDRLQRMVKEKLESKRFLLVIDDVWNENRHKWDSFCAPLRFGAPGTKILVTCRSRKVAETIGAKDIINLKGLKDEPYWQFFKKCAFGFKDSKNYPKLEAIGKKIASRLKGIPLAAKTLGSLLNSDLGEEHWKTVMESEIWDLMQNENDILPVLKLSYDYLPPCLKQCFAYCSLFPKDFKFEKDTLVQMWMAQGFIITSQRKLLMEDVGRGYVKDLLSRGLFEQVADDDGKMMMHDLLHDLAQSISKDECYQIDEGNKPEKIPHTVYHLSVCDPNLEPHIIIDICNKHKKLRTLLFDNYYDLSVEELDQLLCGLTCMRVLVLKQNSMTHGELPDGIGDLKQLRYLDVYCTNAHKLPESLCRLYNLQVLKLQPAYKKVSFPKGVTNLINLRHLLAKVRSVSTIAGIGRLTSLQNLILFSIRREHGYMIEELKDMDELRGDLCIENLENIDSKEEASRAKLDNKMYLKELQFEWAYERHTDLGIEISDAVILEGLRPHSNLEKLKIVNYGGHKCPSWLESQFLSNLVEVSLRNFKHMVRLPPLGQLPYLKVLELEGLKSVKEIGEELYGTTELTGFPSLERLLFNDMSELEKWSGAYGSHLFPCLKKVSIRRCPKLRNLHFCLPPSLKTLRLQEVGLDVLPGIWVGSDVDDDDDDDSQESSSSSRYHQSASLYKVDILNCPNLKSLEEFLLPNQLTALERMSIEDCGELTSLPIERFKYLSSLEDLMLINCPKLAWKEEHIKSFPGEYRYHTTKLDNLKLEGLTELKTLDSSLQCFTSLSRLLIINCPQLKAIPEDSLPSSLRSLHISNCHPDLKERCQKDTGDDWPNIAHIPNIEIDGERIVRPAWRPHHYPFLRTNGHSGVNPRIASMIKYWADGRSLKRED